MRCEVPGFESESYNPLECIIPGYIQPKDRQSRSITNRRGGAFIIPGLVPPDDYIETISLEIIRDSIAPILWDELGTKVFEQTKAHPEDIGYVIGLMMDTDGDHNLNGTLRLSNDRMFQANSKTRNVDKRSENQKKREERFWGDGKEYQEAE